MFGDVWRAGFSIDEMLRADVQISVGFDSPKFRSVEHGAGPARHRRLIATRIDDTVVQLMFLVITVGWYAGPALICSLSPPDGTPDGSKGRIITAGWYAAPAVVRYHHRSMVRRTDGGKIPSPPVLYRRR